MSNTITNLLTIACLLMGLFFMCVGALGVYRMPDVYGRMHAGTKCITLGLFGLVVAVMLHLSLRDGISMVGVITRGLLVIAFQFVAAPIGAHLLSRGAHLNSAPMAEQTLDDELAADRS